MLNLSSEIEFAIRWAISVIVCSVLFITVSCDSPELEIKSNAQIIETPTVRVSSTPEVKDNLEQEAIKLTKLFENKKCKDFFNAFPNTFQNLTNLYGYEDEKGGRILFSKYPDHLSYFFDCSEVSALEKLKKVIEIGIGGEWEADTIGTFQDSTFELIKEHPSETNEVLNNLPDQRASSFWFFLLDGAHPTDKEKLKKIDLLKNLLGQNSKQSKLMLEQFQILKNSNIH